VTISDEAPKTEDDVDDAFDALWARVLEAWDDDKPHQAILGYAIDKQFLPVLAGRYRKLQDDEAKGARAKKKIDGIVLAATQMMLATKSPPRTPTPFQWKVYAAAMFLLVVTFLAWMMYPRHH
jgi:hypothetical protein